MDGVWLRVVFRPYARRDVGGGNYRRENADLATHLVQILRSSALDSLPLIHDKRASRAGGSLGRDIILTRSIRGRAVRGSEKRRVEPGPKDAET